VLEASGLLRGASSWPLQEPLQTPLPPAMGGARPESTPGAVRDAGERQSSPVADCVWRRTHSGMVGLLHGLDPRH